MCQSNAYLVDRGVEVLVLEDVAWVEVGEDQVTLRSLFGEPVAVCARIKEIDLIKNRIVLERIEEVT